MSQIDESQEYQDPYTNADEDETLPELQQAEASPKPILKRVELSNKKMPVHLETTTARERYEAAIFKHDTIRRKYDIRRAKK